MAKVLECRWCGEKFPDPPPLKRGETPPRSKILVHADHELRCKENPDYTPRAKPSSAWNPMPWTAPQVGALPAPRPTVLTFVGGPLSGRVTALENFLIDGTSVAIEPPLRLCGPVSVDSAGRGVTKWMGHYELRLRGDSPIYVWIETIQPKKRLPKATEFRELWPELAARIPEDGDEPSQDRDDPGGDAGEGRAGG